MRNSSHKIKEMGAKVIGVPIAEVLGKADSVMGSGIDYRLFYLRDALLIVSCDRSKGTIESLQIVKPGSAR